MAELGGVRDWPHLPEGPLALILSRLQSLSDYFAFTSVCTAWKAAADAYPDLIPASAPCLLLSDLNPNGRTRSLLLIADNWTNWIRKNLTFPPGRLEWWCFGSSEGWLMFRDGDGSGDWLCNPFHRRLLQLPRSTPFPFWTVDPFLAQEFRYHREAYARYCEGRHSFRKAIVYQPRPLDDLAVVVIYGSYPHNRVAFWTEGDVGWTEFQGCPNGVVDLTSCNGKIVGAVEDERLVNFEIHPWPRCSFYVPARVYFTALEYLEEEGDLYSNKSTYLVDYHGQLLMVVRYYSLVQGPDRVGCFTCDVRTFGFRVYRLDDLGGWDEEEAFSEEAEFSRLAIFVGQGHSECVLAADFPGLRGGCIYFSDDFLKDYPHICVGPCRDQGVYNLRTSFIEDCFLDYHSVANSPPIWYTPKRRAIGCSLDPKECHGGKNGEKAYGKSGEKAGGKRKGGG